MSARSKQTLEWIVTAVLACVFVAAGLTKLIGLPLQVDLFHRFDLPHWVLLGVGTVEVVLVALLISRTTRPYAAMGLVCVMIGASFAHVMAHVMLPMLFVNAALCFAAGWLVLQHRPGFLRVRRPA